jgi:diguanylate cyclase (GGDEF)-like protein/PAS domain S-box-containing protein
LAEKYRLDDQQVMNSGLQKNVEETIGRGGEQVWVETYKAPLKDEQNRMLGTVGFARDISERKQAEETLKLAALVFENSSEAMLVTDADNIILNVNAAFMRMTGYSREEVIGKDPKILGSGEQSPAFYQAMWQSINATGSWHGEIRNKRKSGEIYIEEIVINTIFDNFGRPQRRVALFSDITHRKQTEEQIWQQANFDPLTGLPNRSLFRERMGGEIKKAQRTKSRFAVLFIDLDRFKEVNDTLGHEIGDELLKQAAQRLLACVRSTDTVARLGGDEFTVILEDLDSVESPERVVKQLVEQLSLPFTLQHEQVYVSASIGVTLYPDDAQTLTQLLKNADQAMYAAKNSGRNCYSFFTPSMQANLIARAAMMHDLRSALGKQEFKLVYQPIVELTSGKVYKAEALIRWQHPERGLVSPAVFVPLAEDSGLINDIGDWVFHTAAQQVAMWRQSLHPEFQISINKSPIQFLDVNHQPADWILHLHNTGLPGQAIVVEITEGLLLEASEKTAEHLLVFRDAGVQVAIDDFGTGYSALSYLNKFDIDYLKIDQSFVRNLNAESSDFVLCEAIIVMAHKLGLKVIAEGVETDMQRDLLASINCDFGQGYLFARPMSAEDFTERYAPDQKND